MKTPNNILAFILLSAGTSGVWSAEPINVDTVRIGETEKNLVRTGQPVAPLSVSAGKPATIDQVGAEVRIPAQVPAQNGVAIVRQPRVFVEPRVPVPRGSR